MGYEDIWYELMDFLMKERGKEDEYSSHKDMLQQVLDEMLRLEIIKSRGECSVDTAGSPYLEDVKMEEEENG